MGQKYLDTSVRRTPVRFHHRELVNAGAGRKKATYTELLGTSFAAFKSKGGTPTVTDGVLTIIDTAEVWITYRADIKRGDRMELVSTGTMYDILHVENIDMQGRDCKLTVRGIGEAY